MKPWPVLKMERKFPGLPKRSNPSNIRMDLEYETYLPTKRLLGIAREVENLGDGYPRDSDTARLRYAEAGAIREAALQLQESLDKKR